MSPIEHMRSRIVTCSIRCVTLTAFEREVSGGVTGLVCLRDELMVATGSGHIQRLCWDGSINYSYCVDLRRVPFCDDQLVMKAIVFWMSGAGKLAGQVTKQNNASCAWVAGEYRKSVDIPEKF
ncbi:hypothetical protein GWK47_017158 [Chionoecetes opilio]|uniref:Uncharacterized protein n=1 Tax=Chionoecetes opilio TaxID=41210 RepID=A0A8J4XTZ3_CHIOP|nr:hypothetical protein GWK47_017158 [Chionoecetes opilio]